jgi:hypothetical protein
MCHRHQGTIHMSGCGGTFTKLDLAVLGIVHFADDSMARIKGCGIVMFLCKIGESQSPEWVYFIPRLATNIMSIGQLNEVGYKIDNDIGVLKIQEPRGMLLVRVKREVNHLYLLHIKLPQLTCFAVRGRGDEVV